MRISETPSGPGYGYGYIPFHDSHMLRYHVFGHVLKNAHVMSSNASLTDGLRRNVAQPSTDS